MNNDKISKSVVWLKRIAKILTYLATFLGGLVVSGCLVVGDNANVPSIHLSL